MFVQQLLNKYVKLFIWFQDMMCNYRPKLLSGLCSLGLFALLFMFFATDQWRPISNYLAKPYVIYRPTATTTNTKTINAEDCMVSKNSCLSMIKRRKCTTPSLVSFDKYIPSYDHHPDTGVKFRVPNIIHLIRFGQKQPFAFYNYIAYKSIDKYIKPVAIFLWADHTPSNTSKWWMKTTKEVANIYYIPTQPTKRIANKTIKFVAHAADILRLQLIDGKMQ